MTMQEAPTLKTLLEQHPLALQALEKSLQRQQEAKKKAKPMTNDPEALRCPHCQAEAKVMTIGKGDNARALYIRPGDCCQAALKDTAAAALKYSLNPLGDKAERLEQGMVYARLRQQITSRAYLDELDALADSLRSVTTRVIDSGRCFEEPKKPAVKKANLRLN